MKFLDALEDLQKERGFPFQLYTIEKINRAGLRVMGGFIIGFDGEKEGAGERIATFAQDAQIPIVFLSLLQVLPHTGLHKRLAAEGRLTEGWGDINQTSLLNFEPSRPITEIAHDYVEAYEKLYEPTAFIRRALGMYRRLGPWVRFAPKPITRGNIVFLLRVLWQRGFAGGGRLAFWSALIRMALNDSTRLISRLERTARLEAPSTP